MIGICGLGYTGSGAVMDLLKEYKGIEIQDKEEFSISYAPDGLEDLAYHLMCSSSRYMSSDAALYRFREMMFHRFRKRSNWTTEEQKKIKELTLKYINDITQVKWVGAWSFPREKGLFKNLFRLHLIPKLNKIYNKITRKQKLFAPNREMRLSIKPEKFYERTRQFISDIFNILGCKDDKNLVVNQAFSGDNPEKSFVFFNNPKAIVVDKDPRDLYFLCKKEVFYSATWTPTEKVDDFIEYYQNIRKNVKESSENVLNIRFEDLIYEYDKTVKIIEEFLGLKAEDHVDKYKYFNPKVSENNTQLFIKYASEKKDIEQIEKRLSKYLYPYQNYKEKTDFGKSF